MTTGYRWWAAAAFAAAVTALALHAQALSFLSLDPAYSQTLFGVTDSYLNQSPKKGYLGGVVVLQNGDVIAAECQTSGTRLHRFSASATYVDARTGTTLHQETMVASAAGGCGITLRANDPYIYSNMNDGTFGVAKIDPATGAVLARMGPGGNALGIAADPLTNHVIYPDQSCKPGFVSPQLPTCTLVELDPDTGVVTNLIVMNASQVGYVDGIAFDPSGTYLFLTNRFPSSSVVVIRRSPGPAVIVQRVPLSAEPVGLGFHASSPKFVVTNNQDGTMTRLDFPNDDYTQPPAVTVLASGGFRGDLMQAGPDSCLYVTQDGVRYDNGDEDPSQKTNSIVRICGDFATPPGITPNPPPAPSSLCGFAYHDANDNGTREPAEAGIAGVAITLTGRDDRDISVNSSTTTTASGSYCFNALRPGTYTIAEAQPPTYLDGRDTQGTPGTGTSGNDRFSNITLAAGVNGQDNDFGELLPASLAGYVYVDANNDGVRQGTEAGIAGVTVRLTGTDNLGSTVDMSLTTGADGAYAATGLRPGTYTLTESQPPAYADGKDTQGTPGNGTASNDVFSNIRLASGTAGQNNNFGELAATARVAIEKRTNGSDNDTGTGPKVAVGSTVTWTYVVTNTGNVPLSNVAVKDDKAGAVSCPAATLGAGASITCTKTGKAVAGQYTNVGTVTANAPAGTPVTAQDVDHYFGLAPEKNPPTCTVSSSKGPPLTVTMIFKDAGSGIVSFQIVDEINLKIVLPAFTPPSNGPLVAKGTRIDPRKSTGMTIKAIDFFGNEMFCDPVTTTVTRLRHEKGMQTFTGISGAEHFVTVENDSPGLRRLDVVVNGETFRIRKLDDYEVALIDVASAMKPGLTNTITLVPFGKKGDSAVVMIADH